MPSGKRKSADKKKDRSVFDNVSGEADLIQAMRGKFTPFEMACVRLLAEIGKRQDRIIELLKGEK